MLFSLRMVCKPAFRSVGFFLDCKQNSIFFFSKLIMNSILRSIGLYVKSSGFFLKNNNNNFVTQIKGKIIPTIPSWSTWRFQLTKVSFLAQKWPKKKSLGCPTISGFARALKLVLKRSTTLKRISQFFWVLKHS